LAEPALADRHRCFPGSNPILIRGKDQKAAPCSFFGEQKESFFAAEKPDLSEPITSSFSPIRLMGGWRMSNVVSKGRPTPGTGLRRHVAGLWTGAQQVAVGSSESPFGGL